MSDLTDQIRHDVATLDQVREHLAGRHEEPLKDCLGCELAAYRRVVNSLTPDHLLGRHDEVHNGDCVMCQFDTARAEAEQLRYERRLLGACRRHLDEIADPEGRYTADAIRTAGDLAQRIVDEIGHSVTDEPALGPSFREEIGQLRAQRDNLLALCDNSDATGRLIHPGQIRDLLPPDQQ